jgi:hypothetical protein
MNVVIIVGGVIIIWVVIGQNLLPGGSVGTSPGGTGGNPGGTGGNPCAHCKEAQKAYQAMSRAEQALAAAAWAIKWTACKAKGCL